MRESLFTALNLFFSLAVIGISSLMAQEVNSSTIKPPSLVAREIMAPIGNWKHEVIYSQRNNNIEALYSIKDSLQTRLYRFDSIHAEWTLLGEGPIRTEDFGYFESNMIPVCQGQFGIIRESEQKNSSKENFSKLQIRDWPNCSITDEVDLLSHREGGNVYPIEKNVWSISGGISGWESHDDVIIGVESKDIELVINGTIKSIIKINQNLEKYSLKNKIQISNPIILSITKYEIWIYWPNIGLAKKYKTLEEPDRYSLIDSCIVGKNVITLEKRENDDHFKTILHLINGNSKVLLYGKPLEHETCNWMSMCDFKLGTNGQVWTMAFDHDSAENTEIFIEQFASHNIHKSIVLNIKEYPELVNSYETRAFQNGLLIFVNFENNPPRLFWVEPIRIAKNK